MAAAAAARGWRRRVHGTFLIQSPSVHIGRRSSGTIRHYAPRHRDERPVEGEDADSRAGKIDGSSIDDDDHALLGSGGLSWIPSDVERSSEQGEPIRIISARRASRRERTAYMARD